MVITGECRAKCHERMDMSDDDEDGYSDDADPDGYEQDCKDDAADDDTDDGHNGDRDGGPGIFW